MINPLNNPHISQIRKIKKTDKNMLNLIYRNSQKLIRRYENIFSSKMLDELYTDKFHYNGNKPYMTTVKEKHSGLAVPVKILCINDEDKKFVFLKSKFNMEWGSKFFTVNNTGDKPRFGIGYIESKKNDRIAGIGIRLTQVHVEEAMKRGIDEIPCSAYPASLPFHTMMGFRPKKEGMVIHYLNGLKEYMRICKEEYSNTHHRHFKPIIYKENGKFYFWHTFTASNAVLNDLKNKKPIKDMNLLEVYKGEMLSLVLKGKHLEKWKQRVYSQPITFSQENKASLIRTV